MNLSQQQINEEAHANMIATRRAANNDRQAKARRQLGQLKQDVARKERELIDYFEQINGVEVGKSKKTGAYYIKSFKDKWKVPREFIRLLLQDESLRPLSVQERHERMLPKALRVLNVDPAEDVSTGIWNKPLEDYQLEQIVRDVTSYGYHPTAKHKTVAHFLKLLKAGKTQDRPSDKPTSVGEGEQRVSFSDKKAIHFGGVTRSVQWRGNSGRVRIKGVLVDVFGWLAPAGHDRNLIIALSDNAEALAEAKRRKQAQATKDNATIEALISEHESPMVGRHSRRATERAALEELA